jgi:glucose/arabinose dehydrogenase
MRLLRGTQLGLLAISFAPLAASLALVAPARAVTPPTGFRDSLVCADLNMPIAMAFLPGPAARGWRLLVAEQKTRRLQLVVNGVKAPPPPDGEVSEVDWEQAGERGLLSLAVDPRWPDKPYVYLHYTSFGAIHLARYRMAGDVAWTGTGYVSADTASKMYLLADVPDIHTNHNGGALRFGPDGMLYFSTGDDEQGCIAQDSTSLAGKVLRLDVTHLPDSGRGPAARAALAPADNPHAASPDSNARLVWARGLRNPFRMHFDPVDGALFIADVGQVTYEEVNRITGPANLGWPWYENTVPYTTCGPVLPAGLTFPIATLLNPPNQSIVSLSVYRAPAGASNPYPSDYEGDYFCSDYSSGIVHRFGWNGGSWALEPAAGQPATDAWGTGALQVTDGAIGPDGSLWYLLHGINYGFYNGQVRRIVYVGDAGPPAAVDGVAPGGLRLAAPRPNPARGEAEFAFTLPVAAEVDLAVYDAAGRRVAELAHGPRAAGEHRLRWDGRDAGGRRLPPGVYHARLRAGAECRQQALVLLR